MSDDIWYCKHCGAANSLEQTACFACGQAYTETAEQAPLLHQRYRLQAQIGAGGFGWVYHALDTQADNRSVAIKQINLRDLTPQQIIEATDTFNRELRLLSGLAHPQLPRIYEHFTDPDHWYLVMSFIAGDTLERVLERRLPSSLLAVQNGAPLLLPWSEILNLALQLCTVLEYLHTRTPPIIFRDLKPSNIMYTTLEHTYMIIDFGIARHYKSGQSKDTIPFGSPGYAAPEQYGKAQTTPQSDIYSLGALLYYLISGHNPEDDPFRFVVWSVTSSTELQTLEALVSRMVALDASQRPASMREVQKEIERIRELDPQHVLWSAPLGQTPPLSWPKHVSYGSAGQATQYMSQIAATPRPSTRRSFLLTTLAVGSILGAVVPIAATFELFSHISERGQRNPNASQEFSPFPPLLSTGGSLLIQSFNVVQYAASSGFSSYSSQIKFIDTQTGRMLRAPLVMATSLRALAISPNKKMLLIIYRDIALMYDISSGKQHLLKSGFSVNVDQIDRPQIDWSPDGSYIAIGANMGDQKTIWSWPENKLVSTINLEANTSTSWAWSSDSHYLAGGDTDGYIHIFDPATGVRLMTYGEQAQFEASSAVNNNSPASIALAWSQQGKMASADNVNRLFFWEAAPENAKPSYMTYTGMINDSSQPSITHMQWSPDELYLATIDLGTTVSVYGVADRHIINRHIINTQPITYGAMTWQPLPTGGYQLLIVDQVQIHGVPTPEITFHRWNPFQ